MHSILNRLAIFTLVSGLVSRYSADNIIMVALHSRYRHNIFALWFLLLLLLLIYFRA